MAKDYSFDVVCRTDLQEAANAVNQASKEIGTRYDFKGSKSSVTLDEDKITLIGDDDFKLKLVKDIIEGSGSRRDGPSGTLAAEWDFFGYGEGYREACEGFEDQGRCQDQWG